MKVYISGKVTGEDPVKTKKKFMSAESEIKAIGHVAINPIRICSITDDWTIAMKKCIIEMMSADVVYALPDSSNSKGALIELSLAKDLKIPIYGQLNLFRS